MATCGEILIKYLEAYGVELAFGIPGVHTLELYRGLHNSKLRHVSPRHEQGAGFMADGYARLSGKAAACFVISGPGVTNILTPMGQAYADSVPMLVIASVTERRYLGLATGQLHEMLSQRGSVSGVTAYTHTVLEPDSLPGVLAEAFAIFSSMRPRPVYIELPVDVLISQVEDSLIEKAPLPVPAAPARAAIAMAAELLKQARSPLIILGGGAVGAASEALSLVERLNAPVVTTINAKGSIPGGHPLLLGSTLGFTAVRNAVEEADVVLVVGSEMGATDQFPNTAELKFRGQLIRIDIDPQQLHRPYCADLAILADARLALEALNRALKELPLVASQDSPGARRAAEIRRETCRQWGTESLLFQRLLEVLQEGLPDLVVIGDSTQPVYQAMYLYNPQRPRSFFSAATGFGTLGYALPAAIGAKLAAPNRPVVAMVGDGGLQYTLPELASAVQAGVAVIVLLWNNDGYGEIRRWMLDRGISPIGAALYTPDFPAVARAYGCLGERATSLEHLKDLLMKAHRGDMPALIEIHEGDQWLKSIH